FPGSDVDPGTPQRVGWVESSRPTTPLRAPGGSRRLDPPSTSAPATLGLLLLALAAALLCFAHLGAPLQEPGAARYAETPRQSLARGGGVVPVLPGQPYPDKPPLLYWLVMGSYQIFGVHDWSARLVPCLAAFLTVLVTWWWGRWSLGPRGA